jgi:hypothetical protein
MATVGPYREVHHRLVGMPNVTPPPGSTIHFEVTDVTALDDDGAIEIVMRYLDHD